MVQSLFGTCIFDASYETRTSPRINSNDDIQIIVEFKFSHVYLSSSDFVIVVIVRETEPRMFMIGMYIAITY